MCSRGLHEVSGPTPQTGIPWQNQGSGSSSVKCPRKDRAKGKWADTYHPEEEVLHVHCGSVSRDTFNDSGDVCLVYVDVGNLVASEVRAKQGSRMLPFTAVCRENTVPQQRSQGPVPVFTQPKVFEFERQNCLDISRLNSKDHSSGHHFRPECGTKFLMPAAHQLKKSVLAGCAQHIENHAEAQRAARNGVQGGLAGMIVGVIPPWIIVSTASVGTLC